MLKSNTAKWIGNEMANYWSVRIHNKQKRERIEWKILVNFDKRKKLEQLDIIIKYECQENNIYIILKIKNCICTPQI